MSESKWKNYFNQKAQVHGASVKSSDYFDDTSFFMQRENTLQWLGELKHKEILDAGCGVGAFSEPLVAENKVYGVDFSEKSLAFAADRGLITQVGDLKELPFADGKFDVVLCIGVIQLIEEHLDVIRELARVTAPGGTLLLQTLHKCSIQRKVLKIFEHSKKFDKMYATAELKAALAEYGFEDIQFLKMYHPFKFVTKGSQAEGIGNVFCTSFAIKGRKKIEQ